MDDHSRSPRELPTRGVDELRRALRETPPYVLLRADGQEDQPLRHAARALADEARQLDAVRAERLLIELRRVWRDIPEARRLEPQTHEEVWARLVKVCIEEFYRSATRVR